MPQVFFPWKNCNSTLKVGKYNNISLVLVIKRWAERGRCLQRKLIVQYNYIGIFFIPNVYKLYIKVSTAWNLLNNASRFPILILINCQDLGDVTLKCGNNKHLVKWSWLNVQLFPEYRINNFSNSKIGHKTKGYKLRPSKSSNFTNFVDCLPKTLTS